MHLKFDMSTGVDRTPKEQVTKLEKKMTSNITSAQ